jgi:hypothetical protein
MNTWPYVTLVIAKTILFCIQNGGAYVQTNPQTNKQTNKQTLKVGKASPIASCGCVLGLWKASPIASCGCVLGSNLPVVDFARLSSQKSELLNFQLCFGGLWDCKSFEIFHSM